MKKVNSKGITLIALVITIIVLLILAGVSISSITGQGGILDKANMAKEENLIKNYEEQLEIIWQGVKLENIENEKTQEELLEEGKKEIEKNSNFKNVIVTIQAEELLMEIKVKEGYIFQIRENEVYYIKKEGEIPKDIEVTLTASEIKDKKVTFVAKTKNAGGRKIEYIFYINGAEFQKETTYNPTFSIDYITSFGKSITAKVEVNYEEKTSVSENITIEDNTIANQEELDIFKNQVNAGNGFQNKTVELVSDIDLQGSETNQWVAIGNETNPFKGSFNGNFHTIKNLYVHKTNGNYQGLFGNILKATVENVVVENVNINVTNGTYIAGIAGRCLSSTIKKCGVSGELRGYNGVGRIDRVLR